ncbi:Ubiquitin carboxyl-terminal hydrolase 2 [Linum perenne]
MAKKIKKKGRAPQKEKRVVSRSPSNVPHQPSISLSEDNVGADLVVVPKQRRICAHLDKGFDLTQFSEKINSSDSVKCEDCQEAVADRRGAKGKSKHGKKKGPDSKSDSKAIWICLKCGHFACGGVGLPTNSQCHAMQHAKQNSHPLVIQLENTHLRWCFKCNSLIPADKAEDGAENKDAISDAVKVIKAHSSHSPSVHVEDVWLGSGSIFSEVKAAATVSCSLEGNGGYMVRGLVNLGNTCFFNSVMQNLLAMNSLRSYFFSEDSSFGPLSIALRKLYDETRQETGMRNVINPRSFFGCLCSKAPQFRGYQQHDSHELLRCLLDAWSTEELARRKQNSASEQSAVSVPNLPTFVDAAFGGRISSTVCCMECAHSSTVYEPFLDLSLPVPTKKPPTKKLQSLSRGKKTKLPPKRAGKVRPKISKDTDRVHAESATSSSTSNELGYQTLLTAPHTDNVASSSCGPTVSDSSRQTPEPEEKELVPGNVQEIPHFVQKEEADGALEQTASSFDEFAWMDYLEPETISIEKDLTSQVDDLSIVKYSEDKDAGSNGKEVTPPFGLVHHMPYPEPESSSVNPWEEEVPLQVQSSEVLLLPYYEECVTGGEIIAGEAETSSSVVGCGQDEAAFDGFGDLFNEPEVFIGPVAGPALSNGLAETALTAGNSSESDPGEVDDSDSPVSVESCLAHFIKPELLSNDNAWECENCSKTLHLQERKARKKLGRTVLGVLNGGVSRSPNLDTSCSTENTTNGEGITDALCNSKGENMVSNGGETDCTSEVVIISENGKVVPCCPIKEESESQDGSHGSSMNGNAATATATAAAVNQESNSQSCTNVFESEESEDEEKTTKKVTVKRDATKRVLIDKAPPILTIHLKRFSQDFRGRLSKLNGHVNFRDVLDIRPYMDPRCEDRERSVYRLTGVVEHLGTMRGGHYVAYIRGGERTKKRAEDEKTGGGGGVWYHVSDAYVREASLDEVLRCEAYILFYERV